MVKINLKSFIPFIPSMIFAGSSYFGRQLDQIGADNFKTATEGQLSVLNDLNEHPINSENGQIFWSKNVSSLTNPDKSIIDRKIGFDGGSMALVATTQYGLGILGPVAAIPALPYAVSTASIAYSEWSRNQDFNTVVKGLWRKSCEPEDLQVKLKAADNIGNSYNSGQYAKYVSDMYKLESASVVTEGLTVAGGLLASWKAAPVSVVAATATAEGDPAGFSKASAASAAAEAVSKLSDADAAPAPTPTVPAGMLATVVASGAYAAAYVATTAAAKASAAAEVATNAAARTGLTTRDAVIAAVPLGAYVLYENTGNLFEGTKSAGSALLDTAYSALSSARDSEVSAFVSAREEVRHKVMDGFLKVQVGSCPAEELIQYTKGCGEQPNEIIENLLSGVEGCSYNNPLGA